MKKISILICLQLSFLFSMAQTDTVDLFSMSLEDLLNFKITVATKKATTIRESPGIISMITGDEITKSGARDLADVLQLIPGLFLGTDVQGAIGIGIRGNWAHEGKALLLVNGIEFNELLFGTNQFGNHFSANMIKRIEIIRGPGSAMYGGNAELMVINVITHDNESLNGLTATGTYGQMKEGFGRSNLSLSVAKQIKEFKINASGFYGDAIRSDKKYTDIAGNEFNFRDGSAIETKFANLNMEYKGLFAKFIYDSYSLDSRQWFGGASVPLSLPAIPVFFNTICAEVKYEIPLDEKIKIIPKINYYSHRPWASAESELEKYLDTTKIGYYPDASFGTDISDYKYTGNVTCNYEINEHIDVNAGLEYQKYGALAENENSLLMNEDAKSVLKKIDFENNIGYVQSTIKTKFFNATLGGRYEMHNITGNSFVPRIGLTKVIDKFHFKLLFSQSFRAPNIQNITLNYAIKPEKADVSEIELGYAISKNLFVSGNVFHINLKDPIIYYVDSLGDAYKNFKNTGSKGFELDANLKLKAGYSKLTYSYYNSKGMNTVDLYAVENRSDILLGFPTHKITFNNSYRFKQFDFSPSMIFLSERFGYYAIDDNGETLMKSYSPAIIANMFIWYNNLLTQGLNIGVGCYNILDANYQYIQPYNGGISPTPSASREILLKINYKLSAKKI